MKKMKFRVPDGIYAEIADEAKARQMSLSAVVRERLLRAAAGPDDVGRLIPAGKDGPLQRPVASGLQRPK
jgi:hypothetical protein